MLGRSEVRSDQGAREQHAHEDKRKSLESKQAMMYSWHTSVNVHQQAHAAEEEQQALRCEPCRILCNRRHGCARCVSLRSTAFPAIHIVCLQL